MVLKSAALMVVVKELMTAGYLVGMMVLMKAG